MHSFDFCAINVIEYSHFQVFFPDSTLKSGGSLLEIWSAWQRGYVFMSFNYEIKSFPILQCCISGLFYSCHQERGKRPFNSSLHYLHKLSAQGVVFIAFMS